MKRFLGILLVVVPFVLTGQVFPNQFPEETSPDESNFEVYSQKTGTNKRAGMASLRTFFGAEIIDQVSPPALFGNPESLRNKLVNVSNGQVWFVDFNGDGVVLANNTTLHFYQKYNTPSSDTLIFNSFYPITSDRLEVFENGKKLVPVDEYDVFQGMAILKWRLPFTDYEIIIK